MSLTSTGMASDTRTWLFGSLKGLHRSLGIPWVFLKPCSSGRTNSRSGLGTPLSRNFAFASSSETDVFDLTMKRRSCPCSTRSEYCSTCSRLTPRRVCKQSAYHWFLPSSTNSWTSVQDWNSSGDTGLVLSSEPAAGLVGLKATGVPTACSVAGVSLTFCTALAGQRRPTRTETVTRTAPNMAKDRHVRRDIKSPFFRQILIISGRIARDTENR